MNNKDNPMVEAGNYPEEIWLQFFGDGGDDLGWGERSYADSPIFKYDAHYVLADDSPGDAELLDWLQEQLEKGRYTGHVVFRMSTTGRGWRLHESNWEGSETDVRQAIRNGMEKFDD